MSDNSDLQIVISSEEEDGEEEEVCDEDQAPRDEQKRLETSDEEVPVPLAEDEDEDEDEDPEVDDVEAESTYEDEIEPDSAEGSGPGGGDSGSDDDVCGGGRGTLILLRLKNFMTFRAVAFRPAPGFNVILAPNGAGKSSLLSALMLCLGGDLADLRRQVHFGQLVNVGEEDDDEDKQPEEDGGGDGSSSSAGSDKVDRAEIEVWLRKGPPQPKAEAGLDDLATPDICHVFQCTLFKDKRRAPLYALDGEPKTRKEVADIADQMQIQPGNLCQFLAQDAVREFPELSPAGVFHATLRAVGDRATLDMNDELRAVKKDLAEAAGLLNTKRNTLRGLDKNLEEKREIRRALEEYEGAKKELDIMSKKEAYLLVHGLRDATRTKLAEKKESEAILSKLEADSAEAAEAMETYLAIRDELAREEDELQQQQLEASSSTGRVSATLEQIDLANEAVENARKSELRRAEQAELIKAEMADVEATAGNLVPAAVLRKKLAAAEQAGKTAELELERLKQQLDELRLEEDYVRRRLEAARRRKAADEDNEARRLGLLRQCNEDAYQGVMWLRENVGRFSGTVHEPVMTTLKLADPAERSAVYVQKLVGRQDLEAFVCEQPEDASKLMEALRKECKLKRINVIHSAVANNNESFSAGPASPSLKKRANFRCFVADLVLDCPDAVRAHLCRNKGLHKVPVFSEIDDDDTDNVDDQFPRYFVDKKFHTVRRGRYAKAKSVGVHDLSQEACPHFLSATDSQPHSSYLDEAIAKLESELSDVAARASSAETSQLKSAEDEVERHKEKIRFISAKLSDRRDLEAKKQSLASRLACLKGPAKSFSEESEEQTMEKIKALTRGLAEEHGQRMQVLQKGMEAADSLARIKLKRTQLELVNRDAIEKNAKVECSLKQARYDHDKLKKDLEKSCQKFVAEKNKLEWDKEGSLSIPKHLTSLFSEHGCPGSLPQLRAKMSSCQRHLQSLPQLTRSEANNIHQLTERRASVRNEAAGLKERIRNGRKRSKQIEGTMLKRIESLADRVSAKFSELMESLNCSGCVVLSRGVGGDGDGDENNNNHDMTSSSTLSESLENTLEDSEAVATFGLEIKVAFGRRSSRGRKRAAVADPSSSSSVLHRLSSTAHSGGEKSLVTAVYMMALQDLTQVPFRCVDEINQGMDAINERGVWDLLLSLTRRQQSQYFYLSPKYPRHLPLNDTVAVIQCLNGSVMKERREMKTDRYIRRALKLNRSRCLAEN